MLFSNFLYIFACKMTETGKMILEKLVNNIKSFENEAT